MKCFKCDKPAVGICKFCGRAVCEDHFSTMPYILSVYVTKGMPKAIVINDVLCCGICKPHPAPIDMPELL